MRVAAAVLLVAFSAACTEPDVPKYDLNSGAPTIQIPIAIRLSALQGIGADAQHAYVTASLRDQQGRGIADTLLLFSTSKGTIEPAIVKTNVSGEAKTTLTNGTDVTISVSGAGLTASMDVALAASLAVSLSASRAEKNVPVTLTANVTSDNPPLRFVWNFGDGQTAETDVGKVTHTWAEDGPVKLEVSVTDAIDRRGTSSLSIIVRDNPEPPPPPDPPPPPPAPSIQVTVSASQAIAGQPTTLTATATLQNGAPAVTSYDWDCVDDGVFESTTPGNMFVCTYPAAGSRTARVRAHGGTVTGEGTVAITVLADAPLLVSIAVASPPVRVNVSSTYIATVSVAPPATVPPSGLQFYWDEGTGSFGAVTSSNMRAITLLSTGPATIKVKVVHLPSGREVTNSLNVTVVP